MQKPPIIKYLVKDRDVGTITTTSRYGVQHICSKIDPDNLRVIVEYGPGTGVFSEFILKNFINLDKLVLIEKNIELYSYLKKTLRDRRVFIFNDSAVNVNHILKELGGLKADYIISGIPFSYFNDKLKLRIILNTWHALNPGGKFFVYQYRKLIIRYLSRIFSEVNFEIEMRNFPPLFIFESKK